LSIIQFLGLAFDSDPIKLNLLADHHLCLVMPVLLDAIFLAPGACFLSICAQPRGRLMAEMQIREAANEAVTG